MMTSQVDEYKLPFEKEIASPTLEEMQVSETEAKFTNNLLEISNFFVTLNALYL